MKRRKRTPGNEPAKRLLMAAWIAASVSGCATRRTVPVAADTANSAPPVPAAVAPVAVREQQGQPTRDNAEAVRPAGYTDDVFAEMLIDVDEQDPADPTELDPPDTGETRETGNGTAADPSDDEATGDRKSQGKESDEVAAADPSGSPDAASPSADSPSASVDDFINAALASHPKLLAARQRVAAATNVIPQAQALPDPRFDNTFWPLSENALQTAGGRVGNQMSVSQAIPFPDKLKTKAVIASREVQIAQAEVDAIAREITESVRLAYYEVWFATRAITIIEQTKDLVADLTRVAEARYRSGGSQQDVLRARLENDRLDEQLITLRKQKQMSQADLATLLQHPVGLLPEASDELGIADTPQQLESLIALAERCNPKLRGLAWEIRRDRDKQRLACLQQYPDLSVGLHWGLISDGRDVISPVADGNDNLSFSVGTTLPIWREKINAGIREASHRTSSTTRRLEAERDELYGKIRRLIMQADALHEQRDLYEDRIIPRTEDTLRLAVADYRGDRTDFFTLIETYRELLMFETQLARIDATLAGTIAQLDRNVGCPH